MLRSIRNHIRFGKIVALLLIVGGGYWAGTYKIAGAVIAPGILVVSSNIKNVQHLEGGIVKEILVQDGDIVKKGQSLVELNETDTEADLGGIQSQIASLKDETEAMVLQLPTLEEQAKDMRTLFKKGYTRKSVLYEIERSLLKMKGDIKSNKNKIKALQEQEKKASTKLVRSNILSPEDGMVMNLKIHTPGGVITPGEVLMSVVPITSDLDVEVKIDPKMIDQVKIGQKANLRFTSFNMRTTPEIQGKVTKISPDIVYDEKTGASYYKVRIVADKEGVGNLKLIPGMPTEGFITTDSRTVISYLMKPLMDQVEKAFRER